MILPKFYRVMHFVEGDTEFMDYLFARDYRRQLIDVERNFKAGLLKSWPEIETYVNRLEGDTTWDHLALMTLVFYDHLHVDNRLSTVMAYIFKNLYLAQSIHCSIKNDEEGQEYNQDLQFAILIGDYTFGYIMQILLDHKAERVLSSLASMICTISEGLVRKYHQAWNTIKEIDQIKAPLYATAFQTAAQLAGAGKESVYYRLGHDLGMAVELLHLGVNNQVDQYVHSSYEILTSLKNGQTYKGVIERVINELHDLACSQERAAVI